MSRSILIINRRKIILFFLFLTPLIDIFNTLVGENLPLGQILRGIMIIVNIWLIYKMKGERKYSYIALGLLIYCLAQAFFCLVFYPKESLYNNITYFLKIILYFTEGVVLIKASLNKKIESKDLDIFFKFSSFIIPFSIIFSNLLNLGLNGRAGFYNSVNAMSLVIVAQIIICFYYLRYEKNLFFSCC